MDTYGKYSTGFDLYGYRFCTVLVASSPASMAANDVQIGGNNTCGRQVDVLNSCLDGSWDAPRA